MEETICYLAGLTASDGTMDHKRIRIELRVSDRQILDDLCKHFPRGKVRERRRVSTVFNKTYHTHTAILTINDVKLVHQLVTEFDIPIGNKAIILKFPKLNTPDIYHYLRGYIDGDGSIGITANNRIFVGLVTASHKFASGYCKFLKSEIGTDKTSMPNNRDNVHNIMITSDNAHALIIKLYSNYTLALIRKEVKATLIRTWVRPYNRSKASPKRWTKEDDNLILNFPIDEVVALTGRNIKSIRIRRWRLNRL